MQPNEVFDLINEMANLALMDIQALRQEFERLTSSNKKRGELVYLPVVDVKGNLTQ
ncbi:Uncharacterised protein [Rodentibacter pneumotropicus]|uniref:Uncharacterized protein n=1 Tax=Rodentibacter pneumotropicus TaxID=758 RepID=A0A3S4TVB3_9PAST|nr:Uncharacterised protein [Rodentibacter pneumotropicus]